MPKRQPVSPATLKRLDTVNAAAEYVGVHPKTVRRWISTGQLAGYRAGPRLIRVDLDEVEAMLSRPILAGSRRG
jgi:excisionase family DNA binding protein